MVEIKEDRSKTYLGKKSRLSDGLEIGGEEREPGLVKFLLKLKRKKN